MSSTPNTFFKDADYNKFDLWICINFSNIIDFPQENNLSTQKFFSHKVQFIFFKFQSMDSRKIHDLH